MSNSLAIQPINLYGLASNLQVAFASLLPAKSANSASPLDSSSSTVQLSASGQVLGAGEKLQSNLEALPAKTAVAPSETPTVTATTASTANQSLPLPPAVTTVETLSSDQSVADATHAVQIMMADSALREVIFNPAYSAFIASSHMSDFTLPIVWTRKGVMPADIPGKIMPINRIGAIKAYQDASSAFVRR